MSLPKQPLEIDSDRQALAPYNFVELPEQIAAVVEGSKLPAVPEEKKGMSEQERAAWEKARDKALRERAAAVTAQLPDQDVFHADRHSGWIDCQLMTASPAYVRAPRTPQEADQGIQSKDLPAFFYEWEKTEPVIPGSTLRGMLRSLIEIASYGKITDVSNRRLIYRAVGDTTKHGDKYREQLMQDETKKYARGNEKYFTPLTRGGYMRKQGSDWYIQPAEERDGTTFARISHKRIPGAKLIEVPGCKNASTIFVRVDQYDFHGYRRDKYKKDSKPFINIREAHVIEASDKPAQGLFAVTLARSGYMFSKRSEAAIYSPDQNTFRGSDPNNLIAEKCFKLDDNQIDDYRNQISQGQEELLGRGGVLRVGQPVFYTLKPGKKEVDFFGHCRMLRLPYPQTPRDFVPPGLRRDTDIDLAEAIFGFTKDPKKLSNHPDKKELRYAGRVRITSARLAPKQENIWLSPNGSITPQILGSPKPTTFQHYLVQAHPDAIKAGPFRGGRTIYDYATMTPSITVIRGNKLFWHKGEVEQSNIEMRERGKENVATRIQPVRAGVQFEFRIQFENLSAVELGALLWVLQIGADDNYRLKLGMGKPLGLGAVKVIPTLHLIDHVARYRRLFEEEEVVNERGEKESKWESGQKPEEECRMVEQSAILAFEQFVMQKVQPRRGKDASASSKKPDQAPRLTGLGNTIRGLPALEVPKPPEGKSQGLADLERIKQLLALLRWPGPDPLQTRYLEIERYDPSSRRGKRNEYDGRPVLPHPLALKQREPVKPKLPSTPAQPAVSPQQEKKHEPDEKKEKRGKVVKWGLGPKRSSGFIKPQPDIGGDEIFVHASALPPGVTSLQKGDEVEYKLRQKEFGMEAVIMKVLDGKESESGR
jgi:CRISPR-associated protein (TIGR03986 family)